MPDLTRRSLLARGVGAAAATLAPAVVPSLANALARRRFDLSEPLPSQREALSVLGRASMRLPDSLPNAALPAGTDTISEIEHVVILMMENHSYDNFLGMLGRGPHKRKGQRPRGDGYTLAADGIPTTPTPPPTERCSAPSTCRRPASSTASRARSGSSPISSTTTAPARDSWPRAAARSRCVTGPARPAVHLRPRKRVPDRRPLLLLAARADRPEPPLPAGGDLAGMTDDIGGSIGNLIPDANLVLPPNGTICSGSTRPGSAGSTTTRSSRSARRSSSTRSSTRSSR